jgi:hypothetical protein
VNKQKAKKRYQELRFGHQTVGPVIQLVNFLMIAYLAINELIPIYIFAPMFIVAIAGVYVVIGNKFRKIQQSTDLDLSYEKSKAAGLTTYEIMVLLESIARKTETDIKDTYKERMKFMKDIGDGKY